MSDITLTRVLYWISLPALVLGLLGLVFNLFTEVSYTLHPDYDFSTTDHGFTYISLVASVVFLILTLLLKKVRFLALKDIGLVTKIVLFAIIPVTLLLIYGSVTMVGYLVSGGKG